MLYISSLDSSGVLEVYDHFQLRNLSHIYNDEFFCMQKLWKEFLSLVDNNLLHWLTGYVMQMLLETTHHRVLVQVLHLNLYCVHHI